jgi:triacylglycerol lipase
VRTRSTPVAFVAVLLMAAAVACTTVPPSGAASGRNPVVLVHGYIEGNVIWGTVQSRLKQAGYQAGDITNFAYDTTGAGAASSAPTAAAKLATAVDAALAHAHANGNPQADKVDIISHSYGGMVSRYCIEIGACAGKVDHWVSLAGADGGTTIAVLPQLFGQGSGAAMAPNSATVQLLKAPDNVAKLVNQGVKVRVFWSPNDGVINPAQNSQWPNPEHPDPAANVEVAGTITHLNIFNDAGVITQTIAFLGT